MRLIIGYLLLLSIVISSCTKKNRFTDEPVVPLMVTLEPTHVLGTSAILNANLKDDYRKALISRGFCLSKSPNPTVNKDSTVDGTGTGLLSTNVFWLEKNTTYYVRVYATNTTGTYYGNEVSFTTLAENPAYVQSFSARMGSRAVSADSFAYSYDLRYNRRIIWCYLPVNEKYEAFVLNFPKLTTAGRKEYFDVFKYVLRGPNYTLGYLFNDDDNNSGTFYPKTGSITITKASQGVLSGVFSGDFYDFFNPEKPPFTITDGKFTVKLE